MESLGTLQLRRHPLFFSSGRRFPSFSNPISSLSFRTPPPLQSSSLPAFKLLSVKASSSSSSSSSSDSSHRTSRNPNYSISEAVNGGVFPGFVKTACISIAAAVFFFLRFGNRYAVAVPVAPETAESASESTAYEETESAADEQPTNDSSDVEALRSLIESNVKSGKLPEAIEALDRLIELEPDDRELPLLKANFHNYMGELELARNEFEELIAKEPFRVEAYHGLAMVAEQLNDDSLENVLKRVEDAMENCKKQSNKSEVRDFKLLIAQIKVMEGSYFEALKAYQELVREEPRDFRPYLCQGIIYTLLKKNDEAEKHFEKFRRLVPKNHPYKEYFDENMFATQLFAQKVEKEQKQKQKLV